MLLTRAWRGSRHLRHVFAGGAPSFLVRARTSHGLTFGLDIDGYIDRKVLDEGFYEPSVLAALVANVPPGGVFWDVGANIGLHAITMKHLRPDVTVVAVEPAPYMAARLMQNARMNGVDVIVLVAALGRNPGYAALNLRVTGNTGISSFRPWAHAKYDGQALVRVDSGDTLVAAGTLPAPSVIKVDVEGFEAEVIEGLIGQLTAPTFRAAVLEIIASADDTKRRLTSLGLALEPIASDHGEGQTNYLVTRSSTAVLKSSTV